MRNNFMMLLCGIVVAEYQPRAIGQVYASMQGQNPVASCCSNWSGGRLPDFLMHPPSVYELKYRRGLVLVLIALLFLCWPAEALADAAITQHHFTNEAYPDDILRIKQRGKLVVSQFQGYAPLFFFKDENGRDGSFPYIMENGERIIGIDITLAHEIATLLDVELEVRRTAVSYNAVCKDVAAGRADLGISALTITPERAVFVRFSNPYASFQMGALINRRLAAKAFALKVRYWDQPQTYLNNTGVIIAQQSETAQVFLARRLFPKATILSSKGTESGINEVADGTALATLVNEYSYSNFLLSNTPEIGVHLKWIPIPHETDHLAVAVSPADTHLLSFVNVVIMGRKMLTDVSEALHLYQPELSAKPQAPNKELRQPTATVERNSTLSLLVTGVALAVLFVFWAVMSRRLRGVRKKGVKGAQ